MWHTEFELHCKRDVFTYFRGKIRSDPFFIFLMPFNVVVPLNALPHKPFNFNKILTIAFYELQYAESPATIRLLLSLFLRTFPFNNNIRRISSVVALHFLIHKRVIFLIFLSAGVKFRQIVKHISFQFHWYKGYIYDCRLYTFLNIGIDCLFLWGWDLFLLIFVCCWYIDMKLGTWMRDSLVCDHVTHLLHICSVIWGLI